jgi:hypothetical protein
MLVPTSDLIPVARIFCMLVLNLFRHLARTKRGVGVGDQAPPLHGLCAHGQRDVRGETAKSYESQHS